MIYKIRNDKIGMFAAAKGGIIRPLTWEGKITPGDRVKITHKYMTPYYTVKKGNYSETWTYASMSIKEKLNKQVSIIRSDVRWMNDPFEYTELDLWNRRVRDEYHKLKKETWDHLVQSGVV